MPLILVALPMLAAAAAGAAKQQRGSRSRRGTRSAPRSVPGYDPTPKSLEKLESALRGAGSPARGSRAANPGTKAHAAELVKQFSAVGIEDVPDDLLVAMIVARDVPGDPVIYARMMLGSVGGNLRVLLRKPRLLGDLPGARFEAIDELRRRAMVRKAPKPITSAYDAVDAFRPHMSGQYEKLVAMYLDRRHNPISVRELTRGNDAHTIVDPKQVIREAIKFDASAVILAHNHPSGDATPSHADVEVTQRVSEAFVIVGLDLLDHLVMVENGVRWTSLRKCGLMPDRMSGHTDFTR